MKKIIANKVKKIKGRMTNLKIKVPKNEADHNVKRVPILKRLRDMTEI